MKLLLSFTLLITLTFSSIIAQDDTEKLGELSVKIGDATAHAYQVEKIGFYENVSVKYDTTLQVRNDDGMQFYYYPQLHPGENYYLHLMLATTEADVNLPKYEMYINLGNEVADSITYNFDGADSSIFFMENGEFITDQVYASNQKGSLSLKKRLFNTGIDANMQSRFDLRGDDGQPSSVEIAGDIFIAKNELQSGSATNISPTTGSNNILKNFAYAAVAGIVIALAVFGL